MSLILLLAGCFGGVSDKNFVEKYAERICTFDETCNRTAFLEVYDDVEECVSDSLDAIDDGGFDPDDCDFDKDKAKSCLDTLDDAIDDCDAEDMLEEDCIEAFDCGDNGGFSAGVTEDNFGDKFLEAYCNAGCTADLSAVCNSNDTSTATGTGECDFDANAAAECVDPDNWSCDPLIEGSDDTYPTFPSACFAVCGTSY